MNTERRSGKSRSAAVSAKDQPQRPRILAGARRIPRCPVRPTRCGWCSAHTAALRETSRRRERILQGCSTERRSRTRTTWERHSRAVGFSLSVRVGPVPVPEGRRRRLAGGKSAPADAAPGNGAELLHAPAGHRRTGPGRRMIAGDSISPRRRAMTLRLRDDRPRRLLRCPAGAWPVWHGNRGPRPLPRAGPRLISSGVPSGRSAKRRHPFSGGLMVASTTARSARRTSLSKSDGAEKTRHRPPCPISLNATRFDPMPPLAALCTTTLQNPRAPRGFFPERGCVRGAPAAAGCPQGTPLVLADACAVSRPLRLVLGGHRRAPWVAAPPPYVPRISVILSTFVSASTRLNPT